MGERYSLPVLPLRDTVVYPGVAVPISAGRPGTVEAVQEALEGDRRLFAVSQKENVDDLHPDILYKVGTVVRIIQTHRVRGGMQLLVQGEGRAQALSYMKEGEAMLLANLITMERLPPSNESDPAFQALDSELRERAAELGTRRGVPAEALNQLIQGVDEPGAFADLVAFDADAVADGATFEDPHRYPVGIPHVVVNGKLTIRDGEQTGTLAGRPIRGRGAGRTDTGRTGGRSRGPGRQPAGRP